MIARPVSHYLVRFGARAAPRAACEAPAASEPPDAGEAAQHAAPDLVLQARVEGRAEALAEAAEAHEAQMRSAIAAMEQRLDEARARWASEEGRAIATEIRAELEKVERRIGAAVAHILRPVLADAIRKRAMSELADWIRLALGREAPVISISGPADLVGALKNALGDLSSAISDAPPRAESAPAQISPEVRVVIDQAVIESQIGAWAASLEQISE